MEDDELEWSPVKRQHFFKVLIGDFALRLRIPAKFVKNIDIGKEARSKTAMLEGPTGRTWHVTIKNTSDGMFFADGWQRFVQDHNLKEHEFLVFRYDGLLHFSVMIFDTSACEKEDFGLSNGKDKEGFERGKLDSVCGDEGKPSNGEVPCTKKRARRN